MRRRTRTLNRWCLIAVLLMGACVWSACEDGADSLARVRERGVLRVALDPAFEPFEFIDQQQQVVGLDPDLAREIASRLGVQVEFVVGTYDELYDKLQSGQADVIISALYPDPMRYNAFVFSPSYFNAGEVVVVPTTSPVMNVNDLAGRRIAIVYGTNAHSVMLEWSKTITPPLTVLTTDLPDVAIGVVEAGVADAAVVDNVSTQIALRRTTGLRVLDSAISNEPYVVAARVEDEALIQEIDVILEQIKRDGALDQIVQKWLH